MTDTNDRPVIDAIFLTSRLVSEKVTSAPARMAPANQGQQLQVNTDTNSNISIGIDDPEKPEHILLQIEFMVSHKTQKDGRELIKYEATHAAQFKIRSATGISNWLAVPHDSLAVYLAMTHGIARRRAEHTFLDMGMHGVVLPIPTDYSGVVPLSVAAGS